LFKKKSGRPNRFFYKGSTRTQGPTQQWGALFPALKPQRYEAEHSHQNKESCNEHLAFTKHEEYVKQLRNYPLDKKGPASCNYFVN